MILGIEGIVLQLGASAGAKRARRALRESQARLTTPQDVLRETLFDLGLDLVPAEYTRKSRHDRLVVFGKDPVLVEGREDFEAVAAEVGMVGVDALPAAIPVVRRPMQALANRTTWGRVAALLGMERRDVGVIVVYAAAIGLTSLATPIAVQALFDVVAFGTLLQPLIVVATILASVLVFSAVLRMLEAIAIELIARRIFVRTATDFAHRIPLIDQTVVAGRDLRDHVVRFLDAVVAEKSLSLVLFDGATAVLQIAAGLLLLAFYHPLLLAFDVALVAGVGVVVFLLGRGAARTAILESKHKYRIVAWLSELAAAPSAFAGTAGGRFAEERADELLADWLVARKQQWSVQLRQFGGMLLLQIGAGVGLLLVGGALVINRQLTLGQLVAAELVMSVTVASLAKLGKLFGKVYDLLAALQKISSVVELPLRRSDGEHLGEGPALSLECGALRVEAGERVGVVNAPVDIATLSEDVRIGGVAASRYSVGSLREHVLVLDRNSVFVGDLVDNLAVADPTVTSSRARRAFEVVTGEVPHDEDVEVLFARALVAQPRLVIVNRLLDHLPRDERERLVTVLDKMSNSTVIVLTDRVGVASSMQRVVRLDRTAEAA